MYYCSNLDKLRTCWLRSERKASGILESQIRWGEYISRFPTQLPVRIRATRQARWRESNFLPLRQPTGAAICRSARAGPRRVPYITMDLYTYPSGQGQSHIKREKIFFSLVSGRASRSQRNCWGCFVAFSGFVSNDYTLTSKLLSTLCISFHATVLR